MSKPNSETGFRNISPFVGNENKPDFKELDLGSPISPLRSRTGGGGVTTSSSSSSSGSMRASTDPDLPKKSHFNSNNHSGESSPSAARSTKPCNSKSEYIGSSVTSPSVNVFPTGNICPSGRILKPGIPSRASRPEVLSSGGVNYGRGSIMRNSIPVKPTTETGPQNYSKGLMVGSDPGKRSAPVVSSSVNGDPEEAKRMGNLHHRKGNFVEALSFYDKAIAMSPSNAAYRFNRSAALMGLKRLVEAAEECEEAVKLDPGYVRAHHRLGSLLLSLGQLENARKHLCLPGNQADSTELHKLQFVEQHLSKCSEARKAGDWRTVLREIDAAMASGADASPQFFACRAEALLKLHQLDDAILALLNVDDTAISKSRIFGMLTESYISFVRSRIELAQGRFDNALIHVEKAGNRDPQIAEITALLNNVKLVSRARGRGNDLFKSERFTEACSAYAEGLQLDPTNSVLYCNRAACWFKLGRWERSIDDCNQALRIRPNYTKALLRRAAANSKLERWTEAVRDYEALRKDLPNDSEIAEALLHAQLALKKSLGEEVFPVEVESVSTIKQFEAAISSHGTCVVHFRTDSNIECNEISPFLDTLCIKYPSVNFLKVDIDEAMEIAEAENVRIVPTFKIYRKGNRVKEMICPSPQVLESSIRHYSI